MISKKMQDAINRQINAEMYSSYLYLSMSAHFESVNLGGFAGWMRVQSEEETKHAMRLYEHVVERGGVVSLAAIEKPPASWKSPLDAFEETLKHERKVTSLINGLVDAAKAEKDHASDVMLQWFVAEQVEEESSATRILEKLKLAGDSGNGLLMLDKMLAKRGKEGK